VLEVALRGDPGEGLLDDVGEDGVVRLGGVGQVVERAALVEEVHGDQPFMPEMWREV
jgi:hypothetical protein